MRLIRRIGTRKFWNRSTSFGLFYCDYCQKEVERPLTNGRNSRSCGCARKILNTGRAVENALGAQGRYEWADRICLSCERVFRSWGKANRICPQCSQVE